MRISFPSIYSGPVWWGLVYLADAAVKRPDKVYVGKWIRSAIGEVPKARRAEWVRTLRELIASRIIDRKLANRATPASDPPGFKIT